MTHFLMNMERVEKREKGAGRDLLLELAHQLREDCSMRQREFAAELLTRIANAPIKAIPEILYLKHKGRPRTSTIEQMRLAAEVMLEFATARQKNPLITDTRVFELARRRLSKIAAYKEISVSRLKAAWYAHREIRSDRNYRVVGSDPL